MRISAREACVKPHLRTRSDIKIIIIWNITLLAFTYPLNMTLTGRETKDSPNWAGSSRSNVSVRHFIILSLKLNSVNSNKSKNILSYPELSAESKITHSDDENCQCDMWHWQVEKQKTLEIERDQETPMYHPGTLLYKIKKINRHFSRLNIGKHYLILKIWIFHNMAAYLLRAKISEKLSLRELL